VASSAPASISGVPGIRIALTAVLALALLLPATAAAQERTITVKGTATQEVPNDAATLTFSVSKERTSKGAALRIVAVRLRAVIAAVQTIPGVGAGDVTTGTISVRKVRGKPIAYRASEGIVVVLHQPEKAGEVVSAAVAAGATGTRGPNFFPSDPEAAYRSTLLAAFDLAKANATALATRAGATLGPAISIDEGTEVSVETAGPRSAKGVEAAPAPPTKPGTSTVTATVRVIFALE
jgi:uncharacterized protein